MSERICVLLPLRALTAATLMTAIDREFPGAVLVEPTPEEVAAHGELVVFEVPTP